MRRGAALFLAASLGCVDNGVEIGRIAEGRSCTTTAECRPGLRCFDDRCTAVPTSTASARGAACSEAVACRDGDCCGQDGFCREALEDFAVGRCGRAPGEDCLFDADCDAELFCRIDGVCVDGVLAGPGEPCRDAYDCSSPLVCSPDGVCSRLPVFLGVDCPENDVEPGRFRVLFELAGGQEFYRLPFPNDVRLRDGHVDLTGHPSPGELFGREIADLYFRPVEEEADGYSLIAPIFMRFSQRVDLSTLTTDGPDASVVLYDIDQSSPTYAERIPIELAFQEGRGRFICAFSLAAAPVVGEPLRPHTTYALVVSTAVTNEKGEAAVLDEDLAALLAADGPDAYTPLRAFRPDHSQIAAATVFTTGDPAAIASRIREAVRGVPPALSPQLLQVARCGVEAPPAPCSCPANAVGQQYAGTVALPVLQEGVRPYIWPEDGGRITSAGGEVEVHAVEPVCFVLTLPETTGQQRLPLVVYAHGTGGSHLTDIEIIAPALVAAPAKLALWTYDGVMHGTRRGDSTATPELLFFNASNPRAARDNVLQGAGDLFAIVALIQSGVSFGDQTLDPERIMFYGHSQGSVVGLPFLRYEPALKAAVIAGAGGDIGLSILEKSSPLDVAMVIRAVTGAESRFHPVIGLMDLLFAPADGISYARGLLLERELPLLMIYGVGDTYVPEVSQGALARAIGLPLVGNVLAPIAGVTSTTAPQRAGVVEFAGTGDLDGHFVATEVPEARRVVTNFLKSAAAGEAAIEP